MADEKIVQYCAPTLAGIKTGNVFSIAVASSEELREGIRAWNRRLLPKGIRVVPLRYADGKALVYVFRPGRLGRDLGNDEAAALLKQSGYTQHTANTCLKELVERLGASADFPHEIGLFLGYPPEDVRGFIEHRDRGCKLTGCWKVYGDVNAARRTFSDYRKCTADYTRRYARGAGIETLAVAENA